MDSLAQRRHESLFILGCQHLLAPEGEQRVHRQRVLAHGALVVDARVVGLPLPLVDAGLPVEGAPLGVPDLLVRHEAQVLVEPVLGVVILAGAPGGEGQPPQRLVEQIAVGIALRDLGEDRHGAGVVARVRGELGLAQARIVGVAVIGVLGLDARVAGHRLVARAHRRVAARALI